MSSPRHPRRGLTPPERSPLPTTRSSRILGAVNPSLRRWKRFFSVKIREGIGRYKKPRQHFFPDFFGPRIMTKIGAPKWWDEISEASPECFQNIWELKINIQIQACWWELTHSTKIVSSHLEIYQLSYSVSELVNTCKFVSPHATSSTNDYTENERGIYCLWDGHVPTRQQWTAVEPC